jgi:hypothetical protein
MADPMKPEFTAQNPIVAAAERLRARRHVEHAVDAGTETKHMRKPEDAEESLRLFARNLSEGTTRLNSILGKGSLRVISMERPLRIKIRFGEKRVGLELDDVHQLVRITGESLDGEYQFDPSSNVPALINLSKISTEAGYGERLTASSLLKSIAQDAELPRPSHLDSSGPLQL